jgi:hypothetical protein
MTSVRKNSRETIRVELSEFNGRQIAGLRVWFEADDGTMRPGKAGIAFKVELLPEVNEALRLVEDEARRRGLLK